MRRKKSGFWCDKTLISLFYGGTNNHQTTYVDLYGHIGIVCGAKVLKVVRAG